MLCITRSIETYSPYHFPNRLYFIYKRCMDPPLVANFAKLLKGDRLLDITER